MPGTKTVHDFGIILGTLVGVFNQQGYRRPGRYTLEHPGENANLIRLTALGGMPAFTRFASIQIALQVCFA